MRTMRTMTTFKSFLNLFRWPNLIIIALSMSMILFFVVSPLLGISALSDGLNTIQFILLVISTILISIGGYIVNDIFDVNADSINKPGKNLITSTISEKTAYTLYWITTVSGVLLGTLLSYLINQINFGLIFLFSAGLLWYYSQKYQCQPLLGNIVISALSAISFGIVWLFEFYALSGNAEVFTNVQSSFPFVTRIITIYMGFAFMVSLLREIIKDMEDYKGDNRFGCTTMPVKFGISTSKVVALVFTFISLAAAIIVQYFFYNIGFLILFGYFFIIDILIVIIIVNIFRAATKTDYTKLSTFIKLLMLAGILSMVLIKFDL